MQLAFHDDRAVRMLQVLLNACDPLGRIEAGAPADVYEKFAVAVLTDLRLGADARDIVALLERHGVPPAARKLAVAFAESAVDWWSSVEIRWPVPSAVA